MDEELVETDVPSVGERLRVAREEKGMSLEDIAAQTRIPQRHLESIERSEWDKLPAPTYTIGFARSYATCVGLDRVDIADQLRTEIGGSRPQTMISPEVFEPADPARTMPKSLVFGAIAAVILLVLVMTWLNKRSLEQPDESTANAPAAAEPAATQPASPPPPAAGTQPVVLTATEAVWLQVYEKGGANLFSGTLQPGQTYSVPPTAAAPLLRTGKPEALRINVGSSIAPAVGPPATKVSDVSLLGTDLLKAGSAQPPAAGAPQTAPPALAPSPRSTPASRPRANISAAGPPPATEPPTTTNAGGE